MGIPDRRLGGLLGGGDSPVGQAVQEEAMGGGVLEGVMGATAGRCDGRRRLGRREAALCVRQFPFSFVGKEGDQEKDV